MWWWLASALAARTPRDYHEALGARAAAQVEALSAAGRYPEALELGRRWQRGVEPSGAVAYEIGYALNRMAKLDEALDAYAEAARLDPHNAAARYDRGEILLALGREEEARLDLEAAAALRPDHWAVHFRLAELAGRRGDAVAFEAHLTDAVRNGFSFEIALQDPRWRGWFRDPALGPVLIKLVTLYGDESILEGL